jgi:hypothetical protein
MSRTYSDDLVRSHKLLPTCSLGVADPRAAVLVANRGQRCGPEFRAAPKAAFDQPAVISTRRGLASAAFGTLTVSTPSRSDAVIASLSTAAGRVVRNSNRPVRRVRRRRMRSARAP